MSRRSSKPLYQVVEDHITGLIDSGKLVHGDLVPAEPKLADALQVSPGTVKKAIDNLVWEKRLYRHQGKGTFVSAIDFNNSLFRFTSYGDEAGEDARIRKSTLVREKRVCSEVVAQRLDISVGSEEVYIERVGSVAGEPVLIEYMHWRGDKVIGLDNADLHIPDLMYALIVEDFNVPIIRAEETLLAGAADAYTAEQLEIQEGAPVLILNRTTYTIDNVVVEMRTSMGRTSAPFC